MKSSYLHLAIGIALFLFILNAPVNAQTANQSVEESYLFQNVTTQPSITGTDIDYNAWQITPDYADVITRCDLSIPIGTSLKIYAYTREAPTTPIYGTIQFYQDPSFFANGVIAETWGPGSTSGSIWGAGLPLSTIATQNAFLTYGYLVNTTSGIYLGNQMVLTMPYFGTVSGTPTTVTGDAMFGPGGNLLFPDSKSNYYTEIHLISNVPITATFSTSHSEENPVQGNEGHYGSAWDSVAAWIGYITDAMVWMPTILLGILYWFKLIFIDNLPLTIGLYVAVTGALAVSTSRDIFTAIKKWIRYQRTMMEFLMWMMRQMVQIFTIIQLVAGEVASLAKSVGIFIAGLL